MVVIVISNNFYAHSRDDLSECDWQPLIDHLTNTAEKSSEFAEVFGYKELSYIIGLLHDIGKYTNEFQDKLYGKILKVDHSTAGAKEAESLFGPVIGRIISYCIAGHHSGLPNFGSVNEDCSLKKRLNDNLCDYSAFNNEVKIIKRPNIKPLKSIIIDKPHFTISFLIRMLYSCLVDADFLDTEKFMSSEKVSREFGDDLDTLLNRLNNYLKKFEDKNGIINEKRAEILEQCIIAATKAPGLYSLTVPTGGGKTLASLAFGLNHAVKKGMRRVIYVIPYTSIIEQNAMVFRDALGNNNVLEHHSSYSFENMNDDENNLVSKMKFASENWDIPLIATTNVQFFESLFANKSSKCRKLHNIASSVIILDEAQMLPVEYLKPCLYAISELVTNYNCTIVLCTATQPAFEELLPQGVTIEKIISNSEKMFEVFHRVSIANIGVLADDGLSFRILGHKQSLCIVNTRKHAKRLYEKVKNAENSYHLSTLMCPVHRRLVLNKIRHSLANNLRCSVISTQLIEAGVDIDFPVVYRSMAGLDSIVQSAGRCNREGKQTNGDVYIFKTSEDYGKVKGWLHTTQAAAETALRFYDDPLSLEAIDFYFKNLYDIKISGFDSKEIIKCFEEYGNELEFDFTNAADKFKLIDNNMYLIVIPFDGTAEELINEAKYSMHPKSVLRKIQQYTVSIYETEYEALLGAGALEDIHGLFMLLRDKSIWYDEKEGLIIPDGGEALFS